MNRVVIVALSAAAAILTGAAAALLGSADAQGNGGAPTERGPYGPGTGATPPAAQGAGAGRRSATEPTDERTTTSGAEAAQGKPYVPGTGVGRIADEERASAERDETAPVPRRDDDRGR